MESAHTSEAMAAVESQVASIPVRVHSRLEKQSQRPEHSAEQNMQDNQLDIHQQMQQQILDQELSVSLHESEAPVSEEPPSESVVASSAADTAAPYQTFDASPVEDEPQSSVAASDLPSALIGNEDKVSKKDLVALLEGFVKIIKTDDGTSSNNTPGTAIEIARGRLTTVNEAKIDDRTVEIDQLRGLVIEAQDTIIKLLTDRVEDRSRIATLEAQLSLMPDLQAQADRAMSVAVRTEEYRTELTKMKFELDRFRLFRVRIEGEQKKGTVFNRIQKWLFSRPNAADTTLPVQANSFQKTVDSKIEPPQS